MSQIAILSRSSVERQLRDRIEELEEELRQRKEVSRPEDVLPLEWRLEPSQRKLVLALARAPGGFLTHEALFNVVNNFSTESDHKRLVAQQVLRARRRLGDLGIQILARWGHGYEMPSASRAIIKSALEQRALA